MRCHGKRAGLISWLEHLDVNRGFAGRGRLVIVHAVINRANEHGSGAERGIIETVVPFGIGLRGRNRLHRALKLDQDHVHTSRRLAGSAVRNCAGDGPRENGWSERNKQRGKRKPSDHASCGANHGRGPFADAAWRVAGVGAPPVRVSMSARTRAASISSDALISS